MISEDNRISTVGVFLVGAGLGAAIALLFAPKSGKETRRLISRKAEDGADFVTSKGRELRRQAEDFQTGLGVLAHPWIGRGRHTLHGLLDQSQPARVAHETMLFFQTCQPLT